MEGSSLRRRLYWITLTVVLLIALGLRAAAYAIDPKPDYLANLTAWQAEMARNILDHDRWFVINRRALDYIHEEQIEHRQYIDPAQMDFTAVDRDPAYRPQILEVPGLAVFMTGLWSVTGQHYSYVRWSQILLDTVMVFLVFWIALQLTHNRRIAFASATMYALWPGAIILAKTPSLDTWASFFAISSLALFIWARTDEKRLVKLALLGLTVGVGVYFRPFTALLPVAFAIADAPRVSRRHTLENVSVPVLLAALVVAPWTARNFVEFNQFIPMRIGVGQALWSGLGQAPNNFGAADDDRAAVSFGHARRPDLEYPSPEFDEVLLNESIRAIAGHPLHYVELVARRSVYLLPCLLALLWRRRLPVQRALLVATAVAIILPYVFLRMENRFWLPAAFAYFILLAITIQGALESASEARRVGGRSRRLAPGGLG